MKSNKGINSFGFLNAATVLVCILLGVNTVNAAEYAGTWTIGGTGFDMGLTVAIDNDGNVYYGGHVEGEVDLDPTDGADIRTTNGGPDAFITKMNNDGTYGWSRVIGDSWFDRVSTIITDDNGNVYVTGQFTGSVEFNPAGDSDIHTSANGGAEYDMYLTKLNADGSYGWTTALGGYSYFFGKTMEVDSAGNIYLAAAFSIPQDFEPEGAGDVRSPAAGFNPHDAVITKINADGTYGWTHTLGNTGYDMAHSVAIDDLDNVYVAGHFQGTVDLDPTSGVAEFVSNNNSPDLFVSKFDTDGNYKWSKTFGGPGWDGPYGIEVDKDRNLYISGIFSQTTDFDPTAGEELLTSIGYYDIYVTKFNADDGSFAWAKSIGEPSAFWYWISHAGYPTSNGVGFTIDDEGNSYIARCFVETMDFDPSEAEDYRIADSRADVFVTKLNVDGSYGWTETMSGSSNDCANSIKVAGNGDIFVAGNFQGTTNFNPAGEADIKTSKGSDDIFITKIAAPVVNTAPVANAGNDQVVACTSATVTQVTLDASLSSDINNDVLSYLWTGAFPENNGSVSGITADVSLALGTTTVSLLVNDGQVDSLVDMINYSVVLRPEGLQPPLVDMVAQGQEVPLPDRASKQGRVLPLKLEMFCGASRLSKTEVNPPRIVAITRTGEAIDLATIDPDAGAANDNGVVFRDAGDKWIHNLNTTDLTTGTYTVTIEMPDGTRYDSGFVLR